MGEPSGIGPQLTLRAWLATTGKEGKGDNKGPCFFTVASPSVLRAAAMLIGVAVPIQIIAEPAQAIQVFPEALPVVPLDCPGDVRWGHPQAQHQQAVIDSLERVCAYAQQGSAAAVVTNPIHKESLYAHGFPYAGHTEFLARFGGTPVMMLAGKHLRVALVTTHCPLRAAIKQLNTEMIRNKVCCVVESLRRDFAIGSPRLAMAALNPHAGENGTLGDEEQKILIPTCHALRAQGIDIDGPLSADTLFVPSRASSYDAVICLYHDQGLIPFKALCFDEGVNVTLGIDCVRTSPAHGVAFDRVGDGSASVSSLLAALRLADTLGRHRRGARQARATPHVVEGHLHA